MSNTTLASLGSSVCVNNEDEHFVPALGNAAAIPGDACCILTTGKVGPTKDGATEEFVGFLMESPVTGTEAAIADGTPCSLVVPKGGHRYRIRILDTVDIEPAGTGLGFSATDYKMDELDDAELAVARLSLPMITDDDTVCEIYWK